MVAINFPDTPTVGDQFTAPTGVIYMWDGIKWTVAGGGGGGGTGPFLPLTGGTLTGPLTVAPTGNTLTLGPTDPSIQTDVIINLGTWQIRQEHNPAFPTNPGLAIGRGPLYQVEMWTDTLTGGAWMDLGHDGGKGGDLLGTFWQVTGDLHVGRDASIVSSMHLRNAQGRWEIGAGSDGGFFIHKETDLPNSFWIWSDGTAATRAAGMAVSTLFVNTSSPGVGGNITAAGNITGANFPSEARFKDHIEDYSQGLNAITQLRPVSWKWNALSGVTDPHRPIQYGVLADEAEAAIPQAIGKRQMEGETVKTLDDRPVLWALVNAVKELAAKVEKLEGESHG